MHGWLGEHHYRKLLGEMIKYRKMYERYILSRNPDLHPCVSLSYTCSGKKKRVKVERVVKI